MNEGSKRKQNALAMRERLREFSQGQSDTEGPLPSIVPLTNAEPASPMPFVSHLPVIEEGPVRGWRSQGITVYSVDDTRLERLAQFFKAHRIRFGRRGQISLLAGAGIAALERLLDKDPEALMEIVQATMREREGMSARTRDNSRIVN
jgi:hypothetical protein